MGLYSRVVPSQASTGRRGRYTWKVIARNKELDSHLCNPLVADGEANDCYIGANASSVTG